MGEVSSVTNDYPGFQLIAKDSSGVETVIVESTTLDSNENSISQHDIIEHLRSEFLSDFVIPVIVIITIPTLTQAPLLLAIRLLAQWPGSMISLPSRQRVNL